MNETKTPFFLAGGLVLITVGLIVYFGFFSDWRSRDKKEWDQRDEVVENTDEELHALSGKIDELHGESKCNSTADCRIVGLGAPTCGLYKNFLIYSTLDTKEPELLKVVESFNQRYKKLIDLSLSPNSCGIHPAPVRCVSKHCEAVGG